MSALRQEISRLEGHDSEAAEYLLYVIEGLTEAVPDVPCVDLGQSMSPSEARLFNRLHASLGETVSKGALLSTLYHDRFGKDEAEFATVVVLLTRVRAKIAPTDYKIKNVYNRGYVMICEASE